MAIELSTEGMLLDQLITMLQAAQAQGATKVAVGMRMPATSIAVQSDIEWVSMAPVDGTVYLASMLPNGAWSTMGNEAMQSVDW